jgi:hypothetical protein
MKRPVWRGRRNASRLCPVRSRYGCATELRCFASAELQEAIPSFGKQTSRMDVCFARRTPQVNGSVPFRKAYLRSIIDAVEGDERRIHIKGTKDVLERAVLANALPEGQGSQMSTRWRARGDSNL